MTLLICLPAAAKAATVCGLPNPYSPPLPLSSLLCATTILHFARGLYRVWPSAECRIWCLGTWKNICAACSTCGANLHNTCISHKHFDQSAGYTSNTSISTPIHPHLPSNPDVCYFQLKLLRWLELSCKMLAGNKSSSLMVLFCF